MAIKVENGTYRVRAVEWGFGVASNGTEQIGVRLRLLDEAVDLVWYGYFTADSEERTLESLKLLGWDDQSANFLDLTGMGSREARAVVENEEFNGELRPKVQWINGLGLGLKTMMPDPQKAALGERMNRKMARASKAAESSKRK